MNKQQKDYDWGAAIYHGISAIIGAPGWCTVETNEKRKEIHIKISNGFENKTADICKLIKSDLPGDIKMLGKSAYMIYNESRIYRWDWV